MNTLTITSTPAYKGNESIRINRSAKKINGHLSIFRFKDKDTNQFIVYCPSLDVSGYGADGDKAAEMLKFSIGDYFEQLIQMPLKQIENELRTLGWKHDKIRNKEYSKAHVDINGELKNFNAVDNKVERLTLEAA